MRERKLAFGIDQFAVIDRVPFDQKSLLSCSVSTFLREHKEGGGPMYGE